MVKIDDLYFTLPNGYPILKGITCDIAAKDFVVLLGGNGSGKSTLLKMLNRHYVPSAGNIVFAGKALKDYAVPEHAISVITLTQFVRDSLFLDLTVLENAILIETSYDRQLRKTFKRKLFRTELTGYLGEFNSKLADSLDKPLYNLSGGEQQILAFALYLKHQPKLLLLDEHTSALDPKTGEQIMQRTAQIIKEKQLTCIMATHNLDFAVNYGSRVIALNDGKIVYDSQQEPDKRTNREFLLQKCY